MDLSEKLYEHFGYRSFQPNQKEAIQALIEGKDVFVLMPTGGGKSICYQLPAIISNGLAIIISPLIALMKNQVDTIREIYQDQGVAHMLNSSLRKEEWLQVKKDLSLKRTKLLYLAPETLTKEENQQLLQQQKIAFYAIDEAHCISEWGHSFRPEYRRIRDFINTVGRSPIMALTATATIKVQKSIMKSLGMNSPEIFKSSFNRPNLYYEVNAKNNIEKQVLEIIQAHPGASGIVYCASRKKVDTLAEQLQLNNVKALPYHAGLDTVTRNAHQDKFLQQEIDVMIATIAFGMGIDKPDIRFVIHYDMPKSLEGYYQETGRAGRDGREGKCIAFYSQEDMKKVAKLAANKPIEEKEVSKQLISEVINYAETPVCRRKVLLGYFGEEYKEDRCLCDNCRNPTPTFDAQRYIQVLIEATKLLNEKCTMNELVVLMDNKREDILELFEKFSINEKKYDKSFWRNAIMQTILHGFMFKKINEQSLIGVSDLGSEFIKKPHKILFHQHRNFEKPAQTVQSTEGLDQVLYKMLEKERQKVAKKSSIPPYTVFQDITLEEMTIFYPITHDELRGLHGMGEGKVQKYGTSFIQLIKKYVTENDIERPQRVVFRNSIQKSLNKVHIIQYIDRQISLEDMACNLKITFDELLTELESIVNSGTKLDIEYYIDEYMDEECVEDMYECFNSYDSSREAIDELIEEYDEADVKIAYIQYMSQVAN